MAACFIVKEGLNGHFVYLVLNLPELLFALVGDLVVIDDRPLYKSLLNNNLGGGHVGGLFTLLLSECLDFFGHWY